MNDEWKAFHNSAFIIHHLADTKLSRRILSRQAKLQNGPFAAAFAMQADYDTATDALTPDP